MTTPDTPAPAAYADLARAAAAQAPPIAVVLGSGMGHAIAGLCRDVAVSFADIPGIGTSTVRGHRGVLSLGTWAGKRVLVFEGRLHYYEGYTWEQVTLPVRLAYHLGARVLLLTNAAGGIHPELNPGSLLALADQIEWTRLYCWRLPGPGAPGRPRPSPYSPRLLQLLLQAGLESGVALRQGTYASLTGPCYETPAEIRALQAWGADAVGMSTAREAQAGYDLCMACAGLSLITNRAAGLSAAPLHHGEVLATAAAQADRLAALLERFLQLL